MLNYIEAPAWKLDHSGIDFYVFTLSSSTLLKIAYVSVEEKEKGVQRPLSEKRCKDVAKFIDSNEGILANNMILNLPKDAKFDSPEPGSKTGNLKIPDIEKSAWVVDGQHRLFGFQYSEKELDLVCSAFIDLSVTNQAQLFKTINKEQKGINPSVLYDLLPIIKDADFRKQRSQSLVKQLNEDAESPWFNEIKMLGVGKGLVSQAAFARCIEDLIDPNGGPLASYPENIQYKILLNYFNAFQALFKEEWGNSRYVLTKAIGLSAMCGIFRKVQGLCQSDLTVENFIRQLRPLKNFDFSSSTRGKSTNKLGIQSLILEMQNELPDIPVDEIKL